MYCFSLNFKPFLLATVVQHCRSCFVLNVVMANVQIMHGPCGKDTFLTMDVNSLQGTTHQYY